MKKKTSFDEKKDRRYLIPIVVAVVLSLLLVAMLVVGNIKRKKAQEGSTQSSTASEQQDTVDEITYQEDTQDPQNEGNAPVQSDGATVDETKLLAASGAAETKGITIGIDVAKYQGTIDWSQVADAGIDFAMIRVGYRTQKTGEITEDPLAKYNMQEAQKAGIKVGVYFFSSAVTKEEAVEEADWVADYIAQYQITYPVAYNCEGFNDSENRQYSLDKTTRTDIAIAFLDEIYQKGYTPMFYAAKNEMINDTLWETSRIDTTYKVWVSQYPATPYPDTTASDYTGTHAMWQYTNKGTVAGIKKTVDINVAYFSYDGVTGALSDVAPEEVTADVEALMNFETVNETVTAKQETNLRNKPSQDTDSEVMVTLKNGDTATRTGVSDSGWSRVEYNGQTCYAVSNYLTTDLGYSISPADSGDGLKTKFTSVNDTVTAKEEVNLRALPSVTNPDAVVVATIHNGESVTRTGISNEYGWSRVEYNGQTLYCISSYITTVE